MKVAAMIELVSADRAKLGQWRKRYAQLGLPGMLNDKSRPGPTFTKIHQVLVNLLDRKAHVGDDRLRRQPMNLLPASWKQRTNRPC